jgi:hypothetical protein
MKTTPCVYVCDKCGLEQEYSQTAACLFRTCENKDCRGVWHWKKEFYSVGKAGGLSAVLAAARQKFIAKEWDQR